MVTLSRTRTMFEHNTWRIEVWVERDEGKARFLTSNRLRAVELRRLPGGSWQGISRNTSGASWVVESPVLIGLLEEAYWGLRA